MSKGANYLMMMTKIVMMMMMMKNKTKAMMMIMMFNLNKVGDHLLEQLTAMTAKVNISSSLPLSLS